VKAQKLDGNAYVIEMPPELVDPDEQPYLDSYNSIGTVDNSFLLLNFSNVRRINGLGASMVVKLSAIANKRKKPIICFGLNEHHRRMFDMVGLNRTMHIFADSTGALKKAGLPSSVSIKSSTPVLAEDVAYWSRPIDRIIVPSLSRRAINMNVNGRRIVGPVDGFGSLWQKKYRLTIEKDKLSPQNVIDILKNNFPKFQPDYNHFYPGIKGISPGEVIAIDSSTPGGPVSTGVVVLYADNESFTFVTPQGHPESGWVTFSAYRDGKKLIAQILGLARANDPIYELAFRVVGSQMQIKIWKHVLESLAKYLEVPTEVSVQAICVDPQVHWSQLGNTWYNAQARTILALPVWYTRNKLNSRNRE
jgi:anti-anti-sigma regulatory factor